MFKYLLTCLPCERYVWSDDTAGDCIRCNGELFNTGVVEYADEADAPQNIGE